MADTATDEALGDGGSSTVGTSFSAAAPGTTGAHSNKELLSVAQSNMPALRDLLLGCKEISAKLKLHQVLGVPESAVATVQNAKRTIVGLRKLLHDYPWIDVKSGHAARLLLECKVACDRCYKKNAHVGVFIAVPASLARHEKSAEHRAQSAKKREAPARPCCSRILACSNWCQAASSADSGDWPSCGGRFWCGWHSVQQHPGADISRAVDCDGRNARWRTAIYNNS